MQFVDAKHFTDGPLSTYSTVVIEVAKRMVVLKVCTLLQAGTGNKGNW